MAQTSVACARNLEYAIDFWLVWRGVACDSREFPKARQIIFCRASGRCDQRPSKRLEELPSSVSERKVSAGAVSIGHRDGDRRRACDELTCAIDSAVGSTSRTNRGENLAK